jgi:hypothetical protein
MRLLAGYSGSFRAVPFFVDSSIAYRSSFEGRGGEWRSDDTLGIRLLPRWNLLLQLFGKYSPGSIVENVSYTTTDVWGQKQTVEYSVFHTYFDTIAQISVVHPLTNTLSIQAGTFSHIFSGEEWVGNGVLVSVWMNF